MNLNYVEGLRNHCFTLGMAKECATPKAHKTTFCQRQTKCKIYIRLLISSRELLSTIIAFHYKLNLSTRNQREENSVKCHDREEKVSKYLKELSLEASKSTANS